MASLLYRSASLVLLFACAARLIAQTGSITRSDSIDLLHTRIELDLRQVLGGTITAKTTLRFTPKVPNLTTLPLDLLQLTTDSVHRNGQPLTFTHTGENLSVDLGGSFAPTDTLAVDVYYGGDPAIDASGWGGFYTQSTYQYDLGVAFDAVPHSYGRAWFPCFDNFVERCTFEFIVRTASDRTVFANGELLDEQLLGGGERLYHWSIAEPIPSYLASVSSTNYVAVRDSFPSISGLNVPVTLVAKPNDTTDMKASFIHLQDAFDTFERWFGPYRWERVGYCLTGQGAMEHPTNVSYPDAIANGTLQYEETMAHELAHHWFGDLITCRRAEEMYINEGAAEYLSYLFLEDLYGRADYEEKVREVHHDMVSKAHLIDGGWYALSEVPQEDTYGEHSYRKGADIFHTLRGYLGDSLFQHGFTRVMQNNAFSDMSTEELRDSLEAATGEELDHFFTDWIQQPGWATFEVDSFTSVQNGTVWTTTVHTEQKLRHADHFYEQVPISLTFEAADGTRWTDPTPVMFSGGSTTVTSNVPFAAVFALLNADERLALGSTVAADTLTAPQTLNLPLADMTLIAASMPGPSPVRVEEFWSAADSNSAEPFAFHISPDRWWRITGRLAAGADLAVRLNLDGRPTSATLYDPGLVEDVGGTAFIEDSLVLLYRPNPYFQWAILPDVDINFLGSHADGYARLTAQHIALGDFCFAWRKSAVGIHAYGDPLSGWRLFPNPASGSVTIEAPKAARASGARAVFQDSTGRTLLEQPISGGRTRIGIGTIAAQRVFVTAIVPGEGSIALGPLVISH